MQALLPRDLDDPTTEDALYEAYRTPRRDWIRANFVSSIDGSATFRGTAGGLGSPVDQQILAILRAHADVVLVGAGTVRAENYGPLRHSPDRTRLRIGAGWKGPARLAVVTSNPTFSGAERWIAEAPVPPLILTTKGAAGEIPGAEVVGCGHETGWVTPEHIINTLRERDLAAILCEGGPHLLGALAGAGFVDELCLTLSPLLIGPGTLRIVAGDSWEVPRHSRLTQLLEDDGMLFARYRFDAPDPAGQQDVPGGGTS
jgi:riboflavin biosynthesis pyrimidine reductase